MVNRRDWLRAAAGAAVAGLLGDQGHAAESPTPFDRRAIVRRHNVTRTKSNPASPLQVGNGNLAFGADVTGLQTFVAFNTLSQWGWYEAPLPAAQTLDDMRDPTWDAHGRPVPYDSGDPTHPQVTAWAFANPGRINLGRIGLALVRADGAVAAEADLTDARQELDLWTGTLQSRFTFDGVGVTVRTACHPDRDAVAAIVESPLIAAGRLTVFLDFPAPDGRQFAASVGDFDRPAAHTTTAVRDPSGRIDVAHDLGNGQRVHAAVTMDSSATLAVPGASVGRPAPLTIVRARYGAEGGWLDVAPELAAAVRNGRLTASASNDAFGHDPARGRHKHLELTYAVDGREHHAVYGENEPVAIGAADPAHRFAVRPGPGATTLAVVVEFSPKPPPDSPPDAAATFAACERHWPAFWSSGGAIDLSASTDPRWPELERRIVLSQYLLAVNEAGDRPPQESGLVNTGWFGKFHMEMYWWHAAHYALWDRWPLLDRSLGVYDRFLPSARDRAERQGYRGARWTKMTGPDGRNSPFITNALLVWQQPHPMFFAELDYRAHPTPATLAEWRDVLFATADFMASYASWDGQRFVLGPPMAVVSENTRDEVTTNPTFELGYWRFGLRIAQAWRERLGLTREASWDHVLANLSPLPVEDGVYVTYEGIPDMWTKHAYEHPGLTGVFGWLPGDGVDRATMAATFDRVMATWNFQHVWGWDWPMLAMCAARLGQPAKAVDLLLTPSPNFRFDDAGLATGGPFPYFPSNGGLLYAVAMMAAGWDGGPDGHALGFPADGTWVVRHEGLRQAI